MKNRFCRMGKQLLGVACLLSTCGVTYSCSDDYDLDETKPSFLGQSIYDELNARGNFKTVIRLIDDLGYKDVMQKTGSKTLFVANDESYNQFFSSNSWGVNSYDQLSTNQKRLLLNGSMLNNAYVVEMLSTIQGPVKNLCLRQLSALSATDSVPFFKAEDLPHNLNKSTSETPDKRFWDRYTNPGYPGKGIYMALDKTTPMMTHFLQAQMNEKNITPSDISFILNLDGTDKAWNDSKNRSFVYDAEITTPDVTCLNGYFHVLDKVLVTPGNMAEEIRKNPDTKLFSAMLDRFSAPYYDATLTEEYKALHSIQADSVFQKLYIAQRGQQGSLAKDPDGEDLGSSVSRLSFDPGWNAYSVDNSTKEQDMAAMFVPNDEAMRKYFIEGTGRSLIENYAPGSDHSNLLEDLYQIPQNIMVKLINNLMKESFNSTVPSKYLSVMNTAQDQMFSQYPDVKDYKAAIEKVLVANNGVVYVMKDMITPPDFASVSGPVLFDQGTRVMNTAIHADDGHITSDYANAPLRKFYSTYLLAMQSSFSLFVPVDEGLANTGYADPVSFAAGNVTSYRYWSLKPSNVTAKGKVVPVVATGYRYERDAQMSAKTDRPLGTSTSSAASDNVGSGFGATKAQILCDMVDQHIVVHGSGNGAESIEPNQSYYLSRSGAPVVVVTHSNKSDGTGMVVEGGFQRDVNNDRYPNNNFSCSVIKGFDQSRASIGYGNGHTYFLDRPMQPTINNVFTVLKDLAEKNAEYSKFFELCSSFEYGMNEDELKAAFFENAGLTDNQWTTEKQKYAIFAMNGSGVGARLTAVNTSLVRFFNNYRYTIFVPTNDAITQAESLGLPTLESIKAYVKENYTDNNKTWKEGTQDKAKAMITCLVDFLKYHFCDQSYFVDGYSDNGYNFSQSACSDSKTNTFIPVAVRHKVGGLQVFDARSMTNNAGVNTGDIIEGQAQAFNVSTEEGKHNLFARDYELNDEATKARSIKSSSYAVLHGLKGQDFLLFKTLTGGRFDKDWATPAAARAFVKKFGLKK